MSSRTKVRRAL